MKNKLLSILLSTAMLSSVLPVISLPAAAEEEDKEAIEIHVSPDGKSSGSGTIDSPLDSLASAKNAVKSIKAANPGEPIDVIFHEGTYRFDAKVHFYAEDSGTEDAPITYRAAEGEKVYWKGSKLIDKNKIQVVTDPSTLARIPTEARGRVGYIDLAEQGFTELDDICEDYVMWAPDRQPEAQELIVNGERQVIARYPNGEENYFNFVGVNAVGGTGGSGTVGGKIVMPDYRLLNWETADNAMVVGYPYADWLYEKIGIKSINVSKKEITLERNSTYGWSTAASRRIAVMNLLEELDMPGEYYIDINKKILYYYPETTLLNSTMELTWLKDNLVVIDGLSHVNFEGINFEQGRACGIMIQNKCTDMTISGCTFKNFGKAGIYQVRRQAAEIGKGRGTEGQFAKDGLMNFHIDNNIFTECGIWAIHAYFGNRDDNIPSNCTITNNYIHDMCYTNKVTGVIQTYGVGVEIAHNTIHDVSWGIAWNGVEYDIHHNEIYNYMKRANDGGAIYCGRNFINRGNKVHHNYIHDGEPDKDSVTHVMSWGIYIDDKDAGQNVYQNIIVAPGMAGWNTNNGMSNICKDNIIIGTGATENGKNTIFANVAVSGIGKESQYTDADKNRAQAEDAINRECYVRLKDEILADLNHPDFGLPVNNTIEGNVSMNIGSEYSEWVLEHNNISNNHVATLDDFVDPENGDYRLKKTSKLAELTNCLTEDFDMSTIGVQKDEFTHGDTIMSDEFELVYPKNGTLGLTSDTVDFTWQKPFAADSYRVVVAKDHQLTDIVHDIVTYEDNCQLSGFEVGETYYWKVYATNESYGNMTGNIYPTKESDGVPYMFTTARAFKTSNADIEAMVITARAKVETMVEGDGVGQYKQGTRQAILDKLELAERMVKYGGYSEAEKSAMIADLEDLLNNDIYINGGYINLGDFIADAENWDSDKEAYVTHDSANGIIKIATDGSLPTVCGYKNIEDVSRVLALSFRIKISYDDNPTGWIGIGLRSPSATGYMYIGGNDQYYMVIKQGQLELQRNSGGSATILEVVESSAIANNQWMYMDFGVINLGNVGQLVILKINGETVYEAIDTSDTQVMNKGTFALMAAKGTEIEIQGTDKPLDNFDELVAEYSLQMTKDVCVELEKENINTGAFVGTGSKKAYYNGELHDISTPAVGEGEAMAVSSELAAIIFGSGVSAQPKDANGMYNLNDTAEAMGMKVAYSTDHQLAFVSKSMDMHIANLGRQFSAVSLALAMYK